MSRAFGTPSSPTTNSLEQSYLQLPRSNIHQESSPPFSGLAELDEFNSVMITDGNDVQTTVGETVVPRRDEYSYRNSSSNANRHVGFSGNSFSDSERHFGGHIGHQALPHPITNTPTFNQVTNTRNNLLNTNVGASFDNAGGRPSGGQFWDNIDTNFILQDGNVGNEQRGRQNPTPSKTRVQKMQEKHAKKMKSVAEIRRYNAAQIAKLKELNLTYDANGIQSARRGRPITKLPKEYDHLAEIADEDFKSQNRRSKVRRINPESYTSLLVPFLKRWGPSFGRLVLNGGDSDEETKREFIRKLGGDGRQLFEDYVRKALAHERSTGDTTQRNLNLRRAKAKATENTSNLEQDSQDKSEERQNEAQENQESHNVREDQSRAYLRIGDQTLRPSYFIEDNYHIEDDDHDPDFEADMPSNHGFHNGPIAADLPTTNFSDNQDAGLSTSERAEASLSSRLEPTVGYADDTLVNQVYHDDNAYVHEYNDMSAPITADDEVHSELAYEHAGYNPDELRRAVLRLAKQELDRLKCVQDAGFSLSYVELETLDVLLETRDDESATPSWLWENARAEVQVDNARRQRLDR